MKHLRNLENGFANQEQPTNENEENNEQGVIYDGENENNNESQHKQPENNRSSLESLLLDAKHGRMSS